MNHTVKKLLLAALILMSLTKVQADGANTGLPPVKLSTDQSNR